MRGLGALTEDDQGFFGPGTDLVLSLVAVLILVAYVLNTDLKRQEKVGLDMEAVLEAQMKVVRSLAETFETQPVVLGPGAYGIHIGSTAEPDLVVANEATLQRIRFGSHVLFEPDEYDLQPRGERVLGRFVQALEGQLEGIEEIHLQGHADARQTTRYKSNLVLASLRAIEVFEFLRHEGIDPTEHLMSAASYGEYAPVARQQMHRYDSELLAAANDTEVERARNRRIEVILVYTLQRPEKARNIREPTE